LVGKVSVVFHVTTTNKTTITEGKMRVEEEVTNLCRWYQQLKHTQQHDVLMMEGSERKFKVCKRFR
jgi:hypothetical protein